MALLQRFQLWTQRGDADLLLARSPREAERQREKRQTHSGGHEKDPTAEAAAAHVRDAEDRGP